MHVVWMALQGGKFRSWATRATRATPQVRMRFRAGDGQAAVGDMGDSPGPRIGGT
jgi:hypothetical protein